MISSFGSVIQECKALLMELGNVLIYFVRRSANSVAHSFARASSFYLDRTFSMGDVLTELLPCLVPEFKI
uniref:RNase H type-1 domain-containing protein n=1 Tax=Cannabis sativa TaxID=3483 RepID=A0A803R5J5_CANSA